MTALRPRPHSTTSLLTKDGTWISEIAVEVSTYVPTDIDTYPKIEPVQISLNFVLVIVRPIAIPFAVKSVQSSLHQSTCSCSTFHIYEHI